MDSSARLAGLIRDSVRRTPRPEQGPSETSETSPDLVQRVLGSGEQSTRGGLIGWRDEHANTLQLQLRVLSPGVVGGHRRAQTVVAQKADDQLGLRTAADDRHWNGRTIHDSQLLFSNAAAPGSSAPRPPATRT